MTQFPANTQIWRRYERKRRTDEGEKQQRLLSQPASWEVNLDLWVCLVAITEHALVRPATWDKDKQPKTSQSLNLNKENCLLMLSSRSTKPWQVLPPWERNHSMLHLPVHRTRGGKNLKTARPSPGCLALDSMGSSMIPDLRKQLCISLPGKSRLVVQPDISHPCFCLKQRKKWVRFRSALLCHQTVSLRTSRWILINTLLSCSCDIRDKQGQAGCRIIMFPPTSSWKWFCTGRQKIKLGDFGSPSPEQQDCGLRLVLLQALHCLPGDGKPRWGHSICLGRRDVFCRALGLQSLSPAYTPQQLGKISETSYQSLGVTSEGARRLNIPQRAERAPHFQEIYLETSVYQG